MADFHFIRPLWLLLLVAAVILPMVLKKFRNSDSGWSRIIPARLLTPLIRSSGSQGASSRSPTAPLVAAITLLAIALAGPSWRQAPTPLQQQDDSLVIVLDLSLSMLATDAEPNRLTAAKRKIRDILSAREGSLTALVVYAGDAHVVAPLTDDRQTIVGMMDALDPVIMPATGNRADLGVKRGLELLQQGAPGKGRLLLVSDAVAERYQDDIRSLMAESPYILSTLMVGTTEGGPIPLAERGFIRDQGEVVITRADPESMQEVAEAGGGRSEALTLNNADIRALELRSEDAEEWRESERELTVNRWQDDGYWLIWLVIPLALLGWRRGAVILVLFTLLPLTPSPAQAQSWEQLWLREDQRAPAMIRKNPEQAARALEDPDLQGSALYRAGDYDRAAETFARGDAEDALYNRANALARAGKLEEALKAYDRVLGQQPRHEDARFNRKLVEELLKQKQQQQKQQNQSGKKDDKSGDPSNQQQDGNQQGSENQSDSESQSGQGQNQNQSKQQRRGEQGEQGKQDQASGQGEKQPQPAGSDGRKKDGQQEQAGAPAELETSPLTQGQEQWLRRIPDDPGGLLRRKFLQQYQQRNIPTDEGDTPW